MSVLRSSIMFLFMSSEKDTLSFPCFFFGEVFMIGEEGSDVIRIFSSTCSPVSWSLSPNGGGGGKDCKLGMMGEKDGGDGGKGVTMAKFSVGEGHNL